MAEIWTVVASGTIGATSALLGQYFTARNAAHQHKRDLAQRERELWSSFALPAAPARVDAYEEIYDLVQEAIDSSGVSERAYARIRRLVIYLPDHLRSTLLTALTRLLRSARIPDETQRASAVTDLKDVQTQLRERLGLDAVDAFIEQLSARTGKRATSS